MNSKIIFLICIALLTGCHKLESGVVVNKYFAEAHYETYTTVIFVGKTAVPIVRQRFVHDEWRITIEGEYKGKMRQEGFQVSESEFSKINIGDFIRIREAKNGTEVR